MSVMASCCLVGIKCRYDGSGKGNEELMQMYAAGELTHFCPELLSGGSVPRARVQIVGGTGADLLDGKAKAVDEFGNDKTEDLKRGAKMTLQLAKLVKPSRIYLKSKSPSCGLDESRTLGVAAALLKRGGFNLQEVE